MIFSKKKRSDGMPTIAAIAAVCGHGLLIALFALSRSDQNFIVSQQDSGRGFDVTLVAGVSPGSQARVVQTATSQLDSLRQTLIETSPSSTQSTSAASADPAKLMKLFDPTSAKGQAGGGARAPGGEGNGDRPRIVDPFSLASIPGALRGGVSPLWPQVERCWRPHNPATEVAMTIQLDEAGRMIGAPILYRSGPIRDATVLDAEREALRAVRACAPYRLESRKSSSFDLHFAAARN